MAFAKIDSDVAFHAVETVSGRYVDVSAPKAEDIAITDIAWSLSRQARFAGHTMSPEVWSVAQHALFVENLLGLALDEHCDGAQLHRSMRAWTSKKGFANEGIPTHEQRTVLLGGLHHDDSEAYLIDLPSPVKRIASLREPYKKIEAIVNGVIAEALNLPKLSPYEHELIVWADLMALQIEAANLMPSRGRGWTMDLPIMNMADVHLFPKVLHWAQVYHLYLERDTQLR